MAPIAPAVQLQRSFDVKRMVAEVEGLRPETWKRQNYVDDDGTIREAWVDWRCLSLRSVGGNPTRTDPGKPGLVDYANTSWLADAPYFAEILSEIPAPVRAARLLGLGGGVEGPEHNDERYGLPWGLARLHVPITTTPGSKLYLDGEVFQWQPGTFWFGDFNRMHKVENIDKTLRVHLVFDVCVTRELMALFPADYRATVGDDVLFNRAPVPIPADELARSGVRFRIPVSFAQREDDGEQVSDVLQDATIDRDGSSLVLGLDGKPEILLVHIGSREYRFTCWTDERSLQIAPDRTKVTLRWRAGTRVRSLELPAEPLG